MLSTPFLRYFLFIVLLNSTFFSAFAKNDESLALAKKLAHLTQFDITSTQVTRNASARLIRLIAKTNPELESQDLYEKHKQDVINSLAKSYTADQLKKLINIYQNPLMNRFIQEYHKLVLIESTSLLPLYIFQENVKILQNNAKLTNDQKTKYLKLTSLSPTQLHDKNLMAILASEYYKNLVHATHENVLPESEALVNLIYQNIYKKDKNNLIQDNAKEIQSILMNYFNFPKSNETEINSIVKLSTDYFYLERNLEKVFTANEIKEIQKTLQQDPVSLNFLTEPQKMVSVLNSNLKLSSTVQNEHDLMIAIAAPLFKHTSKK